MTKKTLFLIVIFMLAAAPANGKEEIAIVLSRKIIPYEAAVAGFKQVLPGYTFEELALQEESNHNRIITRLQKDQPALVLAVGPEAASLVNESSIASPRVFTMILNPRQLLSDPLPFPGVSMNYPPPVVLSLIKKGFPEGKKIGIFFSPVKNESLVAQYQASAWQFGIDILPYPILSSAEVRAAIKAPEFKPDILLFVPDRVVIKEKLITYIIQECLFRTIPAVGFNTWFANNGAIMSLYLDYEEVGAQTAALASIFMQNGAVTPWVEPPQKLRVIINTKVARKFGIAVSDTITAAADQVIQ